MQLEAKNIGFRYEDGPWLFRGINVLVEPGEIVGISGPSGRGKTTFCRILAGYETPIEGTVTYNGAPFPKKGTILSKWFFNIRKKRLMHGGRCIEYFMKDINLMKSC
ncbi:ATP-binding cassette domain-containing protein [Paenibacillus pini]|uniref:ATP-binding cassette domain-containing protein n=1 Tax=Paenibacillus pini TaxID=669461 RepID=UPI0026C595BC|nr:ATP-binding cassette domain-containing protein [Paenibacillus pini]